MYPERDAATGPACQSRQRAGLVSATAATAQSDPDGKIADRQMNQAAHHVSGPGESFADAVLGNLSMGSSVANWRCAS
jgi:hypothetical protein